MPVPPASHAPGQAAPLDEALKKNEEATEEIKEAADDLVVVHAVLDQSAPDGGESADAKEAVAQTREIERRLGKAAEKLDDVNETLRREAESRAS